MEILTWGQACIDGVYMELRKPLLIEKLFNPIRIERRGVSGIMKQTSRSVCLACF